MSFCWPVAQEMRAQTPPHRLQPATLAFVITALCEHGRSGEVVALFEELLAEVSVFFVACVLAWF